MVFAYGRVPSFIATLGTLSLFAGIGLTILKGSQISFTDQGIQDLAVGQLIPNVQNAALFTFVAFSSCGSSRGARASASTSTHRRQRAASSSWRA